MYLVRWGIDIGVCTELNSWLLSAAGNIYVMVPDGYDNYDMLLRNLISFEYLTRS
jgi:hypothetical protein